MKTVAVIEGFAGGPLHTRQFRRALETAGFKVIKNRRKADIIIAHSAGMYSIPSDTQAKLLILIGPTYWPGRRLIKRALAHTQRSKRYHVDKFGWKFYISKKLLEIYYFFTRHKYMWLGIANNNKLGKIFKVAEGRQVIIIRNSEDTYSAPDLEKALRGHKNIRFVSLPGVHDDYPTNPEPYIALLGRHR